MTAHFGDSRGTFSVEATMIDWDSHFVRLIRSDGGEARLSLDQLSQNDKDYVAQRSRMGLNQNQLRGGPPAARVINRSRR